MNTDPVTQKNREIVDEVSAQALKLQTIIQLLMKWKFHQFFCVEMKSCVLEYKRSI